MLVNMKFGLKVVILLKIENLQTTSYRYNKPHKPPSACGCEAISIEADHFSIRKYVEIEGQPVEYTLKL